MNKIHTSILATIASLLCSNGVAQTSIEQCYDAARANYPLIVRYDLIDKTERYNLQNAGMAYVPALSIVAQATYQTDVTTLPFAVPGFDITPLSKDQYKGAVELNQAIWDGGVVRAKRKNIMATADADNRALDVDMYAIRERVNNLFFGILMCEEQLAINDLLNEELWRNFRKIESYVQEGVANSADLDAVSVEIIANNQRRAGVEATRKAYGLMLSTLVGFDVKTLSAPQMPSMMPDDKDEAINRPELSMFDAQKSLIASNKYAINAKSMLRIGAFAQAAYGNPGLNFLKGGFTPYGMAGVRLSWNFDGLYTARNDKKLLAIQQQNIDAARETFLFNTRLVVQQNRGEVDRLTTQMADDNKIITLRGNIKRSAQAKVEGGTMSVTDMLREVTAESQAIATKALHRIELLMELYKIKYNTNN